MDKLAELQNADNKVKAAAQKLAVAQNMVDGIEKEIAALQAVERSHRVNIYLLKRKHVVASAQEYKTVKEQLRSTASRLIFLRSNKLQHESVRDSMKELYVKSKEEYDKIWMCFGDNVIAPEFGKKND